MKANANNKFQSNKKHSLLSIIFMPLRMIIKSAIWLIAIIVVASFIVPRFIPIEKIIPMNQVNDIISQHTGLNVHLDGKTRLSILPFLGFTARDVRLTNAKSSANEVLNAKKINIKISVFPILAGKLVVKNINIDTATINIFKCKNTINIFSPPTLEAPAIEIKPQVTQTRKIANKSLLSIREITLKNFSITNSAISYKDCDLKDDYQIQDFNSSLTIPSFDSPINTAIDFIINEQKISLILKSSNLKDIFYKNQGDIHFVLNSSFGNLEGDGTYNFNKNNPTFFNSANITLQANDISPANISKYLYIENQILENAPTINFITQLQITKNTVKSIKTSIDAKDIEVSTKDIEISLPSRNDVSQIKSNGYIQVEIENIQNTLDTLKVSIPNIKKYPKNIAIPIYFTFKNGILTINKGSQISIDSNKITLHAIADIIAEQKTITANIDSSLINIDDYIDFSTKNNQTPVENIDAVDTSKDVTSMNLIGGISKEDIMLFDTTTLALDVQININKLIAHNIVVEHIISNTKARNGNITHKTTVSVFDGELQIQVNAKEQDSSLTAITLETNLDSIETKGIFNAFALPPLSYGKINSKLLFKASTIGKLSPYIIANKGSGFLNMEAKNFTIKGIDLEDISNDVKKNYKNLLTKKAFEKYISPIKKSTVEHVSVQSVISNGVLTKNNLLMKNNNVTLKGDGKLNLKNSQLYYTFKTEIDDAPIPHFIASGNINDLSYSINPSKYLEHKLKQSMRKNISNSKVQTKIKKFNTLINNFKK
ncbi:MAG: hypothetical protein ACI9CD_000516 [Candidatus Deianiraeaceae bacterium]|jgi:hypothetical protein